MAEPLRLIGFEHSVYTWIVRLVLDVLELPFDYVETDPFADPPDPLLARYTPLDRVPVLAQGSFQLIETVAICRYLVALTGDRMLLPRDPRGMARMAQVIGLADADVYPIMVRQVFSAGYYEPRIMGAATDADRVAAGLLRATPVLSLLESIAAEGLQLGNGALSLADLHLAPMISYLTRVPEGAALLADHRALSAWWKKMRRHPVLLRTDPLGPALPA